MAKQMTVDPRVYLSNGEGNTLAYASVTLDGCFAVTNIRIVDSEKGPFVAMPSKREKTGEYKDVAYPITTEMRKELIDAVLAEYQRVMALPEAERGYDQRPPLDATKTVYINSHIVLTPESMRQRAIVQATIGGCFVVHGIRVMDAGAKGLFVSMPNRFGSDGEFHDIAYPVTAAMRDALNEQVMQRYERAVEKMQSIAERQAARAAEQAPPAQDAPEATQEPASRADGLLTFDQLTREQVIEVKQWLLTDRMEDKGESPSYDDLANADELISDQEVAEAYSVTGFSPDDFLAEPTQAQLDLVAAGKQEKPREKTPVAERIGAAKQEAQDRQAAREQSGLPERPAPQVERGE